MGTKWLWVTVDQVKLQLGALTLKILGVRPLGVLP